MDMTKVDYDILRFLSDFRIARKKDLVVFTGNTKYQIKRRLQVLFNHKKIIMSDDRIIEYSLATDDKYSKEKQRKMLNVFDMIHYLVEAGVAEKEIVSAREPFSAAVKIKDQYLVFATVFPGNERIQSKLIDLENRNDVVLILQNKEQLEKMSLSKPVVKVFYLDDIKKDS